MIFIALSIFAVDNILIEQGYELKRNFFLKYMLFSILISATVWIALNLMSYRSSAFDGGAYIAYSKSILNDGDFNIINNISPEMGWLVSSRYNYPDMHDHGVSVYWLPFMSFAKIPESFGSVQTPTHYGQEQWSHIAVLIASVFLTLIAFKVLREMLQLKSKLEHFIFWSLILASPIWYYSLVEYSAADIASLFLASLCVYIAYSVKIEKISDYFMWGLLFGLGRVTKISFLFFIFFFVCVAIFNLNKIKNQNRAPLVLAFLAGAVSLFAIKLLNDYLQFGYFTLLTGYAYDYLFAKPDMLEKLNRNIFGPFGLFHQAPWLFVIILCNLFLLFKLKKDQIIFWILLSLQLGIFVKMGYELTSISDSESEYGYRRYIIDIPFCATALIAFCRHILEGKKNFVKKSFLLVWLALLFYAMVYYVWFRLLDQKFQSAFGVYKIWSFTEVFQNIILIVKDGAWALQQKSYYASLLFIVPVVLVFSALLFIENLQKSLKCTALVLVVFYAAISGLNLYKNQSNVESMKSAGVLKGKVVSHNELVFLYDEIVSDFGMAIVIAKYNKDEKNFMSINAMLKSYLAQLPALIDYDPIGFAQDLKMLKLRNTYQNPRLDVQSLLDYNSETYFDKAFKDQKAHESQ